MLLSFLGQVLFNDNGIKSIKRIWGWNNQLFFSDTGLQGRERTWSKLMMCTKPKNLCGSFSARKHSFDGEIVSLEQGNALRQLFQKQHLASRVSSWWQAAVLPQAPPSVSSCTDMGPVSLAALIRWKERAPLLLQME